MEHDIDLRLLRAFVAVAEARGFSPAATALRVTQPALSRRIHDLEAQLGLRLFDRTSRRVRLTSGGEALLAHSHELLAGARDLRVRAQALGSGRAGTLRLGGAPLLMGSVIAPFLAYYRKRCPGVEIQLREQGGVRLLEAVLRGDLHLAVASATEPRLASRPLFPWGALAVVEKKHPLARHGTVELRALAKDPLLVLLPEFVVRPMFDAACVAARLRTTICMESGAPDNLVAMARAGNGVAIIPSTFTMDTKGVKAMPIVVNGQALGRWTAINWDPGRFQPTYAKELVDALVEYTSRDYPGHEFGFTRSVKQEG